MEPSKPDEEQGASTLAEDHKRLQEEQQKLLGEQQRLLVRRTALYQQQASLTLKLMSILEHQRVLFGEDAT